MSAVIRAVSFDVGGTLIEPWPSVGDIYATVAREWGCAPSDPAALNAAFGAAWKKRASFNHARAGWRELVDESFGALGHSLPPGCFEAIYDRFGRAASWRVFDDVRPVLRELQRRNVPVAFISNWDERLQPLLRELQLAEMARAIIVSIEVGWPKPDARIFATAAARLGVPAGEILHVGDSREADHLGARHAGMQARWLRRAQSPPDRDEEIGSLRAILECVAAG
jgi:putative hydrolase of the HAD superfamily